MNKLSPQTENQAAPNAAGIGSPQLTDQPNRDKIATSLDHTLFVNAGAGSGKSTALVERILNLVLTGPTGGSPVPILSIAAITFTEKAGAELRVKLRKALDKVVQNPKTSAEQRQLARQALDNLDGAAIGTIHSFARRIITEHGMAAGIPPAIEIVDAIGESVAFEENWPAMRNQLIKDQASWADLEQAFDLGLTIKDVKTIAEKLNENWDVIETLIPAPTPKSMRFTGVPKLIADEQKFYQECLAACRNTTDKLFLKAEELHQIFPLLVSAQAANDDRQKLSALTKICDAPKAGNLGAKGNWDASIASVDAQKAEYSRLQTEAARIAAEARSHALQNVIYRVGQLVLEEADKRRQAGELQFHDQIVLARRLVTPQFDQNGKLLDDRSQIRKELQQQYRHIFLDEFQDTDPLQIEIATRIAGGAGAGDPDWTKIQVPPGSLFFVGDAKQSIYRFRRANIATYLEAEEHFAHDQQPVAGEGTEAGNLITLKTNFRTVEPIITWINRIMDGADQVGLIRESEGSQPKYQPLVAHRGVGVDAAVYDAQNGPAVTIIGAQATPAKKPDGENVTADDLREQEAADVAGVICEALGSGWRVAQRDAEGDLQKDQAGNELWRPVELKDIVILLPTRTALRAITRALDQAKIPYQADAAANPFLDAAVVDLHRVMRAVAEVPVTKNGDPVLSENGKQEWVSASPFSVVHALRTPLLGCSDVELLEWVAAGQSFYLPRVNSDGSVELDAASLNTRVGQGLAYLAQLKKRIRREALTPARILEELIADREAVEIAAFDHYTRSATWRRLRFITDQARAWQRPATMVDGAIPNLQKYLVWVDGQMDPDANVSDVTVPDLDLNAVRIMTVHGAKGLEFPMVIAAGLTAQPRAASGARFVLDLAGERYGLAVRSGIETAGFAEVDNDDKARDEAEKLRLLYVDFTRAQDHLVVSTHRVAKNKASSKPTLAEQVAKARDELRSDGAYEFGPVAPSAVGYAPYVNPRQAPPLEVKVPPLGEVEKQFAAAQRSSRLKPAITPSQIEVHLGPASPEVSTLEVADPEEASPELLSPEADLSLPETLQDDSVAFEIQGKAGKGGAATRIGTAAHEVLEKLMRQHRAAVAAQTVADVDVQGFIDAFTDEKGKLDDLQKQFVKKYVTNALASELLQSAAAAARVWPETWAGMPLPQTWDDRSDFEKQAVLEGIIDLLYEDSDGSLVILDYKTDQLDHSDLAGSLAERTKHHTAQQQAYLQTVETVTGKPAKAVLLFLDHHPAQEVAVPR